MRLDHAASSSGQHSDSPPLPLPFYDRSLRALRTWLDSWAGSDVSRSIWRAKGTTSNSRATTKRAWRTTFYTTGMEHSPTSATGTGWERTPWHATQRAAWEALSKQNAVRPS